MSRTARADVIVIGSGVAGLSAVLTAAEEGAYVIVCEKQRALGGAVIPGLYAAGYDAGGMYGDSYPIRPSSGLSSGFAINSGRIAGKNAARTGREAG